MKNLKLFGLTVLAMMILAFANANAQNETVLIRTFTSLGTLGQVNPILIVTPSAGESYSFPLKNGNKSIEGNDKIVVAEIQKWKDAGYKVVNVSAAGETIMTQTFLLEK